MYYPAKFTWTQLKTFINSGDLGLLKRDKKLQIRYDTWSMGIRAEYGSMVNYLLTHRLQWGKQDTLSFIPSLFDDPALPRYSGRANNILTNGSKEPAELPPIPASAPRYFTADTPPELISIIMNDWPYSVPPVIEHALVWTRLPIMPPDLPPSVSPRLLQDGLWGFTGSLEPPPSPSTLPACLPALAEWGTTLEGLVRSPRGTDEEEALVRDAGKEIDIFVKRRWVEREWETAWFVNPPRLQSIPGLAHAHVFARHKSPEEIARWVE